MFNVDPKGTNNYKLRLKKKLISIDTPGRKSKQQELCYLSQEKTWNLCPVYWQSKRHRIGSATKD